jgi:hypothetical protein
MIGDLTQQGVQLSAFTFSIATILKERDSLYYYIVTDSGAQWFIKIERSTRKFILTTDLSSLEFKGVLRYEGYIPNRRLYSEQ